LVNTQGFEARDVHDLQAECNWREFGAALCSEFHCQKYQQMCHSCLRPFTHYKICLWLSDITLFTSATEKTLSSSMYCTFDVNPFRPNDARWLDFSVQGHTGLTHRF